MSKASAGKKKGEKSKKKGSGQDVALEVGGLLTAYKASCRLHNLKPNAAVLASIEDCIDNLQPFEKVVLYGPDVDDRVAQAILDAVAGYSRVKNLCFWRCSIGDKGLARVASFVAAAADPFYNGPKVSFLEVEDDSTGQRHKSSHGCSSIGSSTGELQWKETTQPPNPSKPPPLYDVPPLKQSGVPAPSRTSSFKRPFISEAPRTSEQPGSRRDSSMIGQSTPLNSLQTTLSSQPEASRASLTKRVAWGDATPKAAARGGLTPEGLSKLGAALCGALCPLKELSLDHNDIGDAGVQALVGGLRRCPSLQRLSLAYNSITAAGVALLAEALDPTCTARLCEVSLHGNPLGGAGLVIVARALARAPALTALNMADTNVGPGDTSAVTYLCGALRESATLTQLDISLNDIGSPNAQLLLQVLSDKPSILQIRVTERIARALAMQFAEIHTARAPKPTKKGGGKKGGKKAK